MQSRNVIKSRIFKTSFALFFYFFILALCGLCISVQNALGVHMDVMGPLTVHPGNSRYFSDINGKIVYLTGSHTWNNFQETESVDQNSFDFSDYLNFMQENNHNFMRLWVWEQAAWISTVEGKVMFSPTPYQRSGPGNALDKEPKFNLNQFNQQFFDRMRERVLEARNRGIYVAVMLFQGFGIEPKKTEPSVNSMQRLVSHLGFQKWFGIENNPWRGHPYNKQNNSNDINGDPRRFGDGRDVHTLRIVEITKLQERYVKKVIDSLRGLDNVIWEIANESHAESTIWQYHLIDFIQQYELKEKNKHPVLMTVQWPGGENGILFESKAEAISPNPQGGYRDNPPAADGSKVIIVDTDHLWGIGGDWHWVWKSFLMGMNPIFMDPYDFEALQRNLDDIELKLVRKNMGYTRTFSDKVNLAEMVPRPDLASSGYCLADEGREYLVYVPAGEAVSVKLDDANGGYKLEWFDPVTGSTENGGTVSGETIKTFLSPFDNAGVLYLHERKIL